MISYLAFLTLIDESSPLLLQANAPFKSLKAKVGSNKSRFSRSKSRLDTFIFRDVTSSSFPVAGFALLASPLTAAAAAIEGQLTDVSTWFANAPASVEPTSV